MRVQGITQRPDIVAIADAADHINDIQPIGVVPDIPAPCLIFASRPPRLAPRIALLRCPPHFHIQVPPVGYRIFHPHP